MNHNGQKLLDYLHQQFPATVGHIPLVKLIEDVAMEGVPRARARSSDPATSQAAAESVKRLTAKQEAVLKVFQVAGQALTDEELLKAYPAFIERFQCPRQSVSGLRSRRHELVVKGQIADSGKRGVTSSGRPTTIWILSPSPAN